MKGDDAITIIRVLVGTRKGAFILTSDGKRQKWDVAGPLFGGWEVYHMWEALTKGLPKENCYALVLRDAMSVDTLDSCDIYMGATGGQVYCSPDGGDNWAPIVRDLPAVVSVEVQALR